MCKYCIVTSNWIGHGGSPTSTLDNTTTGITTFRDKYQPSTCTGSPGKVVEQMTTRV